MSVSTLFDTFNPAYQSKSIRVYDLIVDHAATFPAGTITPASLGTGATGTVIYCSGTGPARWEHNPNALGNLGANSITFTGDANNNALNYFSTDDVVLTATYSPDSYSAGVTGTFTRIGNMVTLSVPYSISHTAGSTGTSGLLLGDIPDKYSSRTDGQEYVVYGEGPNSDGSVNNTLRPVVVFIYSPSAGGGLANKIALGNSVNIPATQVLNFTRFTISYLH